jgi:hypothetical protein
VHVVLATEVGEQAVEPGDPDVREGGTGLGEHVHPLLRAEQPLLRGVHTHRDHDLVEQHGGTRDDVDVPVGHRVERPGACGSAHCGSSAQAVA